MFKTFHKKITYLCEEEEEEEDTNLIQSTTYSLNYI